MPGTATGSPDSASTLWASMMPFWGTSPNSDSA